MIVSQIFRQHPVVLLDDVGVWDAPCSCKLCSILHPKLRSIQVLKHVKRKSTINLGFWSSLPLTYLEPFLHLDDSQPWQPAVYQLLLREVHPKLPVPLSIPRFIMFKPIFMLCTAIAGLQRSNMAKLQDIIAWPSNIQAQSIRCAGPMESHGTVTLPLPWPSDIKIKTDVCCVFQGFGRCFAWNSNEVLNSSVAKMQTARN